MKQKGEMNMFGRRQGMGINCRRSAAVKAGFGRGNRQGRGCGPMIQLLETPEQEIEVLIRTANCLKKDLNNVNSQIEALKQQQNEAPKAQ